MKGDRGFETELFCILRRNGGNEQLYGMYVSESDEPLCEFLANHEKELPSGTYHFVKFEDTEFKMKSVWTKDLSKEFFTIKN